MVKLQKVRRIFKMRNIARHRNDPERMPLTEASTSSFSLNRDRSPSVDTNSSTSSTETPTRRSIRSYGSFLPNYFNILRNSLRRSTSSQVRKVYDTACSRTSSFKWTIYSMDRKILTYSARIICSAWIIAHIFGTNKFSYIRPPNKIWHIRSEEKKILARDFICSSTSLHLN